MNFPLAGKYQRPLPFLPPEIEVTSDVPEKIEEAVVRHELNHHVNREDENESYGQLIMVLGGITAAVGTTVDWLSSLVTVGGFGILVGMVYMLYELFFQHEKQANDDIDWNEIIEEEGGSTDLPRRVTWLEIFFYIVLQLPGNAHGFLKIGKRCLSRVFSNRSEGGTE